MAAAIEIAERTPDESIKSILVKVIDDTDQQTSPTDQAWALRVAFDLIKDRGRVNSGAPAPKSSGTPSTLKAQTAAATASVAAEAKPPAAVPAAKPPAAAASSSASSSAAGLSPEEREKREKAAKQVMHVCTEIQQTEAAYVSDLQTIITVFMYPARKSHLDEASCAAIFSNVEDLLRCNTAPVSYTHLTLPTILLV